MESKQLGPFVSTRGSTWTLMALAGGIYFAMPTDVTAQDATWTGPGNEWTTSSNWTPAIPTNNALFTNNGAPTAVSISNTASINTMEFAPAATPAYTFTVTNGASFTVNTGITGASPRLPNFRVDVGSTLTFGDGTDVAIGSLADGPSGGGTLVVGTSDPLAYLTIAGGTSTTFSGSISASGSLELVNTSTTLTLTGASNGGNIGTIAGDLTLCGCFGGGLTISGGALTVDGFFGVAAFGGTLSVINGSTLQTSQNLGVASAMAISGPGSRSGRRGHEQQ